MITVGIINLLLLIDPWLLLILLATPELPAAACHLFASGDLMLRICSFNLISDHWSTVKTIT